MLNNFLITGCAGFIGSHVVDVFHGKGHNVIGVDKLTYAGNNLPPYIKNYNIDICETELVAKACLDNDVDCIINFAAESHVDNSIEDGSPFIKSNVEGTFNLIECARKNKSLKNSKNLK